jgi:hypothetical protein
MLQAIRRRSLVTELSLVASLSALYIAFRIIPTFPMIGIPGTFRAGDFFAPLYGIILGPVLGPLAVTIGTVIGFFTGAPPQFLGLDFLPGACSAAMLGLVTRGKRIQSAVLNLIVIFVFVFLPFTLFLIPVGNAMVPYIWLHLVGLALVVSPLSKAASLEITRNWRGGLEKWPGTTGKWSYGFWRHFRAFFVLAFSGTLAQHLTGGILSQLVIGLYFNSLPRHFSTWQDFWTTIFWVYPFERTVIAIVAALIGSASIIALKISRLSERLPSI